MNSIPTHLDPSAAYDMGVAARKAGTSFKAWRKLPVEGLSDDDREEVIDAWCNGWEDANDDIEEGSGE